MFENYYFSNCSKMNVLLLLMSLVAITTEMCIMRLCPLGKFYSTTSGSCVSSCYPGYGNWTTGNCTEGIYYMYL